MHLSLHLLVLAPVLRAMESVVLKTDLLRVTVQLPSCDAVLSGGNLIPLQIVKIPKSVGVLYISFKTHYVAGFWPRT